MSVSDNQWLLEREREPALPMKRPSGVQWDRSSKRCAEEDYCAFFFSKRARRHFRILCFALGQQRWRAFDYGDKGRGQTGAPSPQVLARGLLPASTSSSSFAGPKKHGGSVAPSPYRPRVW